MVSEEPITNRISVNSAEQDDQIESVTVFQANHAEVKRRVKLDLKKGQNHVTIERLPSCAMENSIRVNGTGSAVIFDVVYHRSTQTRFSSPLADETVLTCRRALETLQKERSVAKEQSDFLTSYGKTLDSKSVNIEDVGRFLDMFGPRQIALAKRMQELDIQVAEAQKEFSDAQAHVHADTQGAKRGTKITVTVLAEEDGEAELMLTYSVSNASWTPLYDVRASISKSPDAPSTVALHYRASITQTTGENWPDVVLTLSTASPQLGSAVPTLSAWRIGFPQPARPIREREGAVFAFASFSPASPAYSPTSPTYSPTSPRFEPAAMASRQAQVTNAGVLSATFGIPGRSDVPSDQGSHKVVITVIDFPAELEWICVPKEKESVYLRCNVVNSSEFTLLPGEASVFVDDNFVSKSHIEHVVPNDSFKTSLGVDSALRVTYPAARTLNRKTTQSSFAFLAKDTPQSVAAHSQRITVRNSRLSSVPTLRILDHIPTSTDALVKVSALEPSGLGPAGGASDETTSTGKRKERAWTVVRKGTRARWADLDVAGEGAVEWACDIQPGEEIELDLAWEVSAPVGQKWQNV